MLEVDEENFVDRLMNFATWNYGDIIDEMGEKYPYRAHPDRDSHLKQTSLWAVCKVVNPATGITILDEFVDRRVRESSLKSKILLLKEIEYDLFVVLEYRDGLILAASLNGRGIICLEIEEDIAENLVPSLEFEGLVHPWNIGKTHRMLGEVSVTQVVFDLKSKSTVVGSVSEDPSPGVSLLQILQNHPLSNLEYACDRLGIDPSGKRHVQLAQEIFETLTTDKVRRILERLTPTARDCLAHIACNGGLVGFPDLYKRFGDGFEDTLDELKDVCLVTQVSRHQNDPASVKAYMTPDLLAAMYRLGCLGLKRWHP